MRILLITPWRESKFLKKVEKYFYLPRLSMPTLAAITPPGIKLFHVDEYDKEIDYDQNPDIVGITSWTSTAPRAYEIADRFRKRGVPVVIGGLHVSALPQEGLKHADSVVIGEAECVWRDLLEDFKNGKLKKIYDGTKKRPDMNHVPSPKRNLMKSTSPIQTQSVQATRGCPFSCDFCSVTHFFGNTYRLRPLKNVIEDIRRIKGRFVYFVDDNIVGNRKYAKELFKALIPFKKKWIGQSSLSITQDESLLKLAKKSGCLGLLIGLESLHGANLKKIGNKQDIENDYIRQIRKLHKHGIGIDASLVFGFDDDDPAIFRRTLRFCIKAKVDVASFHLLTPYPGTPLYNKLEKEDRLLHKDWSKYDENHVVFQPKKMSIDCLQKGFVWIWKEFYSTKSIMKRWKYNLGLKSFFFYVVANLPYHLDTRKLRV
ncbi:B12-binding domain-containing radical SAM protein [Candidatus Woesearchaeota archaeon]|nr:B12-binding domain-containing radical SAM protein [Candidatus Woesearchaeota archaeon]